MLNKFNIKINRNSWDYDEKIWMTGKNKLGTGNKVSKTADICKFLHWTFLEQSFAGRELKILS